MKVNDSYIFIDRRITVRDMFQILKGMPEFVHIMPYNKVVTVNDNFVALDDYGDVCVCNEDIVRVMVLPPGG